MPSETSCRVPAGSAVRRNIINFLTNTAGARYQPRIDVILDLMAGKTVDAKDTYYTFFRFEGMRDSTFLNHVWQDIQQTFLQLKDWFENHELYHKIGYLIASGAKSLQEIYDFSSGKTKTEFLEGLESFIKKSVAIGKNYAELSYERPTDYRNISRLLLLFNVESVRLNGEQTQYIPFCTKMVFLKYYTPSGESQIHFWGEADRTAYVETINTVLKKYLEEPISLVKEENE